MARSPVNFVANPAVEVIFAGWRSNTAILGSQGWNVSIARDNYGDLWQILLHHKECDLTMQGSTRAALGISSLYRRDPDYRELPPFVITRAFSRLYVRSIGPFVFEDWNQTSPVRAEISEEMEIHDSSLFLKLNQAPAQEIIVEPKEVAQILEEIMRMQSPRQAEIRKNRAREQVTAQATIVSFGT